MFYYVSHLIYVQYVFIAFAGNMYSVCTSVALQRNFGLYIPRKGTARPQSQLPHSCVCERFIYSHDRSTYFPAAECVYRLWEYINRTPKHECRNCDCGRAVPFLEIYVSNFQYSIFAVHLAMLAKEIIL
jgi:hypothetical protein